MAKQVLIICWPESARPRQGKIGKFFWSEDYSRYIYLGKAYDLDKEAETFNEDGKLLRREMFDEPMLSEIEYLSVNKRWTALEKARAAKEAQDKKEAQEAKKPKSKKKAPKKKTAKKQPKKKVANGRIGSKKRSPKKAVVHGGINSPPGGEG